MIAPALTDVPEVALFPTCASAVPDTSPDHSLTDAYCTMVLAQAEEPRLTVTVSAPVVDSVAVQIMVTALPLPLEESDCSDTAVHVLL